MENESSSYHMNYLKSIDYTALFRDHLSLYQLVDHTKIKDISTIKTARDLDKEAKVISETLRDVKSKYFPSTTITFILPYLSSCVENDWSKRLKALQTIQSIFIDQQLINMPEIF